MEKIVLTEEMIKTASGRKFAGWGTSLAWWANVIGRWRDEDKKQAICDLIFSLPKGLGLTIVRYNFGAGEPGKEPANFRVGANIECYGQGPAKWDMDRDGGQRWILQEAIKRGVNQTEAFFNSPPLWLLACPSTAGADYGQNNLLPEQEAAFAEYVAELLNQFAAAYQIRFHSLSLFNEPSSMWWQSDNDQEGCHYSVAQQERLLCLMQQKIKEGGLYPLTLSGPEGWSVFESISMYNDLSEAAQAALGRISTHTYLADDRARKALCRLAQKEKKPLWMSEVCLAQEGAQDPAAMASGLRIAKAIMADFAYLRPEAWVYWQAVENKNLNHNYGFIQAGYDEKEEYHITKSFYVFGQFTRFIRPGMLLPEHLPENGIIAYDPVENKAVCVLLNETAAEKSCCIESGQDIVQAAAVITSEGKDMQPYSIDKNEREVRLILPAQSILTVEIFWTKEQA